LSPCLGSGFSIWTDVEPGMLDARLEHYSTGDAVLTTAEKSS
jgi:hypothetical protein